MKKNSDRVRCIIRYNDEQDPANGRDVTVAVVGNDKCMAGSYFNPNAFRSFLIDNLDICAARFALAHYHLRLVHRQIDRDRESFVAQLRNPKLEMAQAMRRNRKDRFVAIYDGIETLACLNGFLVSVKSFLDSFSVLVCRSFNRDQYVEFNRKVIDGHQVSGGRLIDWLRNCATSSRYSGAAVAIGDLIEAESAAWITRCVQLRDQLAHKKGIPTYRAMRVPVYHQRPYIFDSEVRPPRIDEHKTLLDYCSSTAHSLRIFVKDVVLLLPDIDQSKLHFHEFDTDEPVWGRKPSQSEE